MKFCKLLALFIILTIGLSLLAGCRNDDAARDAAAASITQEAMVTSARQATGLRGGNVTLGPNSNQFTYVGLAGPSFETLDPFYMTGVMATRIGLHLYDTLWEVPYGEADDVPIVVREWTVHSDGRTVDITIYDNVYDWKGNHITAADIKWFYDYFHGDVVRRNIEFIDEFEQTGLYTLRMVTRSQVFPGYLSMATGLIRVISRVEYERDPAVFRSNPVGTGGYRAIEFISGARAVLQQTYYYWGDVERLPPHRRFNVDIVAFEVITEALQLANALRTNHIQLADLGTSAALDFMASEGPILVEQWPQAFPSIIMLNMAPGSPFANNKALREAVAYGIDMDAVAFAATMGTGRAPRAFGNESLAGYNTEWEYLYYTHDPVRAREKLVEAGHPNGITLSLMSNFGPGHPGEVTKLVIQASLAEIGIRVTLRALNETQFLISRTQANLLEWDMSLYGLVPRGNMANYFLTLNDTTVYPWGTIGGARNEELWTITQRAIFNQTQENMDAVFHATIGLLNYIPLHQAFDWKGKHPGIEFVVKNNGLTTIAGATNFHDDYDVFYTGTNAVITDLSWLQRR